MKILAGAIVASAVTTAVVRVHSSKPVAAAPGLERTPSIVAGPTLAASDGPGASPSVDRPLAAVAPPSSAAPPRSASPSIAASKVAGASVVATGRSLARPETDAPPAPSGQAALTLSEEARRIESASAESRRGRADEALRQLDAYAAAFPDGSLAEEATVLRAEVLTKIDPVAGRALAVRYLREHPGSPYRGRLTALLDTP
jgi:hypothetical protein